MRLWNRKLRVARLLGPMLGCVVIGYFLHHSIQSDHGLIAWKRVDLRIAEAEKTLASLQIRHDQLEKRWQSLHPESLDPDMLEEQARLLLNFGHQDDFLVIPDKP